MGRPADASHRGVVPTSTSLVMSGLAFRKPMSELTQFARAHVLGRGLGRVVAHEIGHWLMGRGHTQRGLMRPSFDVHDLVGVKVPGLPRTWTLTGSEALSALSSRCSSRLQGQVRESSHLRRGARAFRTVDECECVSLIREYSSEPEIRQMQRIESTRCVSTLYWQSRTSARMAAIFSN